MSCQCILWTYLIGSLSALSSDPSINLSLRAGGIVTRHAGRRGHDRGGALLIRAGGARGLLAGRCSVFLALVGGVFQGGHGRGAGFGGVESGGALGAGFVALRLHVGGGLHLLEVLRRKGGGRGLATICIGGGQGGAMLVETV